jgi:TfoX/Sxy family transcriptional regulator of competence genes
MFGGICFLVDGNMAGGVSKDHLMVRIGPAARDAARTQPHVRVFDMTGRPMKNWILVEPAAIQTDDQLMHWIDQGVAYAQSLPPK